MSMIWILVVVGLLIWLFLYILLEKNKKNKLLLGIDGFEPKLRYKHIAVDLSTGVLADLTAPRAIIFHAAKNVTDISICSERRDKNFEVHIATVTIRDGSII